MSLEPVNTHVADAIDLLLSVWKDREKFVAWTKTYVKQVQDLEDAIWTVLVRQGLEEIWPGSGFADGISLDEIGAIVGEKRAGKTDEDYLPFLRAKVKANKSDGHVEQLIEILDLILPEAKRLIRVTNNGYMEAEIAIGAVLSYAETEAVNRFMLLAIDAVLELQILYTYVDPDETFTLSDTYATFGVSPTKGFGSEYTATGGKLSHSLSLPYVEQGSN